MTSSTRAPFDPELRACLAVVGGVFPPTITPDLIPFMRRSYASAPIEDILGDRPIELRDLTVEGFDGGEITVSVLRPQGAQGPRPAVLYAHSGGFMFGDRFSGIDLALDWIERLGAVLVTPEYRLAPEFRDPYPREDTYATLEWMVRNAASLGIRPDRVLAAGGSCGGGMAAGLALASRDRDGPPLCGQLLDYPMLDDRGETASTYHFDGIGVWDRISNETGWAELLGDAWRSADVSAYAAPARASDLSALPPAYIDVGSVEIFRDEAIDYANRLWNAGGTAELHVWAGGFHAFDIFAPHTALSRAMIRTRDSWVEKILAD